MKRFTKTYGVNGMMEWVALIPTGKSVLKVNFTGGSLTGYGIKPAVFTTDNPAVMKIIEESIFFRNERIIVVSKTGGDENQR